ncbi:hypothetical protein [Thermophilibacter immobilis]
MMVPRHQEIPDLLVNRILREAYLR